VEIVQNGLAESRRESMRACRRWSARPSEIGSVIVFMDTPEIADRNCAAPAQ